MISLYVKRNYLIFFFLLFNNYLLSGQVLLSHAPALTFNVGAVVNTVAFDSTKNVYFVAGDFTAVDSLPRFNLCVLDSSNLSLNNTALFDNIITSIDGPINAIKIVGNRLFVGGSFTTINGQLRYGLAVFNYVIIFGTPMYALSSWAPLNNACVLGTEKVNSFDYVNDTLFIGGSFSYFDAGCTLKAGFAAIKPSTLTSYTYGNFPAITGTAIEIKKVKYSKHRVYIGGYDFFVTDAAAFSTSGYQSALCRLKPNGNIENTFVPSWTSGGGLKIVYDFDVTKHGIYIFKQATLAGGKDFSRQDLVTGITMSINVNDPGNSPVFNQPHCLEFYKNKIYYGSENSSALPPSPHFGGRNILDQYPFYDGNLSIPFNVGSINLIQNRLFVSENNMTTISTQPRNTLAVYCLEPYNASAFDIYDSTICPGQTGVIFRVPKVPYAEKYHWFYTGVGANIAGSGSSVILSGISYNQVSVDFSTGLTVGKLCLVPMSSCNERADTLVINILVNPVPNANAGLDDFITCKYPVIDLIGTSSTSSISYTWSGPSSFTSTNDTVFINEIGTYTFTVTSLITGCKKSDNVLVAYDTAKPNVTLPVPPYQLTCADTSISLLGSSSDPQTTFEWRIVSTGNLFGNPISVNAPGQYMFIVTDTLNGCPDSLPLIVSLYKPLPNIQINGYASISISSPQDTITCYNSFFDFTCYSDTSGTVIYFTDTSQTLNYGDSIHVDSGGFYYIVAKNTLSGCENFIGFFISENINQPDLLMPVSPEINCSLDSAILNASTILLGANLTWNGPSITNTPNPITAFIPGYYFATNFDSSNGCSRTDSVLMSYVPEIVVNVGNDTIVCNGTAITLNATYIGSFGGLSYLWNNGITTSANPLLINSSQISFVTITDTSGCIGIDTITIDIPNTPIDSIVAFKPCGSDSSGQLVVYLFNGLAPYTYSLDGFTFQTLSQFNNLPFGNYTVFVQDSLGCNYNYATTIDQNSSLPQPFFLNSTYNSLDDTIVLVDISVPTPDSIQWILPSVFQLIQDGSSALIKASDTGIFQITMRAFYSSCLVDTSKLIYIRQNDTTLANLINENGIKKLMLYANPNSGIFTVELEFYKKQDYNLGIYDINSTTWFSNFANESFGNTYNINISDAVSGTYVLRVVSEFDSKSINFIIQH